MTAKGEKKPSVNWGPDYEKDVERLKEQEEALKGEGQPAPQEPSEGEPTPPAEAAPAPSEPASEPQPAPSDDLQKQIAERDARITELERQVQVEIGKRGGELGFLRNQVRILTEQMENMIAAREIPKPQETPEEEPVVTDEFRIQWPEAAEQIEHATKVALGRVEKTFAQKQEEQRLLMEAQRKDEFTNSVYRQFQNFDEINTDPRWVAFLSVRPRGNLKTRGELANEYAKSFETSPFVEMVEDFLQTVTATPAPEPAAPTPAPSAAKPGRPSLASQVQPPVASMPVSVQPQSDPNMTLKRLQDLTRTLTTRSYDPKKYDDLLAEFNRLSEAAAIGTLK